MNSNSKVYNLVRRIEQMTIVRAVRNALVSMIPVLTIGAFALILQTLPIDERPDSHIQGTSKSNKACTQG